MDTDEKSLNQITEAIMAQCLNYLKATGIPLCLLLNFGQRVEIKWLRGPHTPSTPTMS